MPNTSPCWMVALQFLRILQLPDELGASLNTQILGDPENLLQRLPGRDAIAAKHSDARVRA